MIKKKRRNKLDRFNAFWKNPRCSHCGGKAIRNEHTCSVMFDAVEMICVDCGHTFIAGTNPPYVSYYKNRDNKGRFRKRTKEEIASNAPILTERVFIKTYPINTNNTTFSSMEFRKYNIFDMQKRRMEEHVRGEENIDFLKKMNDLNDKEK